MIKAMTDGRCTVAEALKSGATIGDLIYDHERAFIRVEPSA
jgi:hypothetical protein